MLRACLESLVLQDYPPTRFEVIVADDGSRDETRAIVDVIAARMTHPRVRYLSQSRHGANAARNAALRAAGGDPICFVDDDEDVPPGWLSALVGASLAHPTAACLGGPMRLRFEGRPPRACGREPWGESELDLGDETREVLWLWGGNMALRRFAVEAVGGFREMRLLGHNETEWISRLRARHYPVLYVPEAWVWHRRTQEQLRLRWLVERRFVRGIGQARMWHEVGRPYHARSQAKYVWEGIRHSVGAGCGIGLIDAAQAAGHLVGMGECWVRDAVGRGRRSSH
jgi:glycosyltransferase involved in cell wall biosynthesis